MRLISLKTLPFCLLLLPAIGAAQPSVTCSGTTQGTDIIRNEGKTEQIFDYIFDCTNTGNATATATIVSTVSAPVTSKVLNSGTGATEAALILMDSGGRQSTQTFLGTVSGSTVTFNVSIPVSTNLSSPSPFVITITNVRVDATSLTAGNLVTEAVSIFGTGITTANFPAQNVAMVESGLGPQSLSAVTNFPVCSTINAATPAFNVKFGENMLDPLAFKTQGGSGNTTTGSWLESNTETGYYVPSGGGPPVSNVANSGTRIRVIFTNIPANVGVYVPLTLATDQSGLGTMTLTATESGVFSPVGAASNPAGYTGGASLGQLTVTGGSAEAVYEVTSDSSSGTAETYTVPVYVASGGTVTSQSQAITAQVSFAPVGATANIPYFSQLADTTSLSGSLFPACLTVSSTLANGVLGVAYNQTVMPSGGVAPYAWSQLSGAIPQELSLNASTGAITGTPSGTAGMYPFTITVMDSSGQSVNQPYTVQIFPAVSISSATTPNGAVGESYTGGFGAQNGFGSYTWSIAGGALPGGVTLNTSTGALSGTPTGQGTFNFTIKVVDSSTSTATQSESIIVNPPLGITTSSITTGVMGFAIPTVLSGTGGVGGYSWSLTAGTAGLAAVGITFTSGGTFSGAATATSTGIPITVKLTDGGTSVTANYTVVVNPPLSIPTPTLTTGIVGTPYSFSDPITTGYNPNNCLVSSGAIAQGINVTGTVLFSGTPTLAGTYTFVVRCSDAYSEIASSNTFSLTINPQLTISTFNLTNGFTGSSYSQTLATNGGGTGTGYMWNLSVGSLPAGLNLNASTGVISGTPTTAGSSTFTIGVTDSGSNTASKQFTIQIIQPIQITTTPAPPTGVVGYPYSYQPASTGGTGGNVWSLATGSLPGGLSLNTSTGLISGTPTAPASGSIGLKVQDSNGDSAQWNTSVPVVAALSITSTSPLHVGGLGVFYNQSVGTSGGVGPYTFSITTGALPGGLSLNTATGAITGMPTAGGNFGFTIKVTDSSGTADQSSQAFTLFIDAAITINTSSLPPGTAGAAYSTNLTAQGGSANFVWSATGLPAGLSLSTGGVLSGTPSAVGTTSNITIQVSDSLTTQTAMQTFSLTVYSNLTLDFVDGVSATNPLAYFRLNAAGGTDQTRNYFYSDSDTGTSVLTPGAPITGTSVKYTSFDGTSGAVTTNLSGGITSAASLMAWVNLSTLPSNQSNFSYVAGESQIGNDLDLQFTQSNALGWYTTSGGAFLSYTPNPLTLVGQWHMIVVTFDNNATGAFKRAIYWDGNLVASDNTTSPTPKTGAFQIGATNVFTGRNFPGGIEEVGFWNYALTSAQVAQLRNLGTFLPPGVTNASYGPATISAQGGSGSITYTASPLPAGLSMSAQGVITGTPNTVGTTAPITVTATDTLTTNSVMQTFSATIYQPIVVSTNFPGTLMVGTPLSGVTASAQFGYGGSYYFSVTSGALPSGLSLNATTGAITGTPTAAGMYSVTIGVVDGAGLTGSQSLNLTVMANAPVITTTALPGADMGSSYSQNLQATGGTPPYTWSIVSGSLPTGMSLSQNVISGAPTAQGTFTFTVRVTDSALTTATQTLSITVDPPLTSTMAVQVGTVGNAFNQAIPATGGLAPYTFAALSSLPPGLSLNTSTGAITGTPTNSGNYTGSYRVTDSLGYSVTGAFTITIDAAVSITTTSLPAAQQGTPYSAALAATGGSGSNYMFSVSAGNLPAGVTLSTAGALSGTPTANGNFSVTFKVTDSNGGTGTAVLALNVSVAGTIITANLPANTAIVNISGTEYGAANSSGPNQIYWQTPFTANSGPLLEYTIQPGTYTFRVVDPADASTIYPSLTTPQLTNIFTGWTYNSPWIEAYLVFDSSAVGSNSINQLFSGAEGSTAGSNAQQAYNNSISMGAYNRLFVGARNATATYTYTFTNPETLVFAVPDGGLYDNAGGVSVLISPVFPTPLSISNTSPLPFAVVGTAYSDTFTGSGGSGSYSWSVSGGPASLTMSTAGVLSGTPLMGDVGTPTLSVTLTDLVSGQTLTQTYSLSIYATTPMPLMITTATLPNGVKGTAYPQTLMATGGIGADTWAVTTGTLPAGLTLASNGMISGTPTAIGSSTFTVTATDTASHTATQQYTVTINAPLTITTTSLPSATMGNSYNQTLGATGGLGAYTWTVTQGTFTQAGFSLNSSTGAITGAPTTANTLLFTVRVADTNGDTATQSFSLQINLQTTGLDFAVAMGTPSGTHSILRVSATGANTSVICSGPTCHAQDVTADSSGNIYAHDATGISKIAPNGTVTPLVTFSNNPLFDGGSGVGGIALDGLGNLIFVDNVEDAIYRVSTSGTGLVLVASFPILSPDETQDTYVTLDRSGNYIVVSDDNEAAKIYRFTTAGTPTTLATFPGKGATGVAVDTNGHILFIDNIGNTIYSYDGETANVVASGSALCCAPAGMTIDQATGTIVTDLPSANGLVRVSGAGAITVILSGSPLNYPQSVTQIPQLAAPQITQTSVPGGTVGSNYGPVTLTASGGSGSYTWSARFLPPGITISAAGVLSGVPSTAGTYLPNIVVTDTVSQQTASINPSFVISAGAPPPPSLSISGSTSFIGVVAGGSVSATFSGSGGTPPYTFSATGLPSGVTISSGGTLSGTASAPGSFSATVQVTDSHGASASTSITISVLGLTTTILPAGIAGQFYSGSLAAVGGTQPYSFSASGLPAGLSISGNGTVSGTVKATGAFTFTVKVSDNAGLSVSGSVSVTFTQPKPLSIPSGALTSGTVGTPYSATLSAAGGYSPYTWAVSMGSAPPGLSLGSAGTLSGIPTMPGTFSFGVMATDNSGAVTTATATVTIQALPLTVTTQSLPTGVTGLGYPPQTLAAAGGTMPYTWAVTSGNLPAGLTLSTAGMLSGMPTSTGSSSFTVTVTDASGKKGTAGFTLQVMQPSPNVILTTSSLTFSLMSPATMPPSAQQIGVQSTQPSQPIAYTVTASPAAPWLNLSNGTTTPDTISASLSAAALTLAAGTYSTTLSVTCTSSVCAGNTQTASVALNVVAAPPQLSVGTDLLSFGSSTSATQSITQSISVQNSGGGSLGIASVSCEATWCSAGGVPGSLAGGVSAAIPVTINPTLLTAGFFRTQVDITSSAGRASVPITVLISAVSTITLAPAGQQFTMQQGGAPGNPGGSFLVTVVNGSALSWSASVQPGAPWLSLSNTSGSSTATAPGSVGYSINSTASTLAPGAYYGIVTVVSYSAVNSPQNFEVVLSVAAQSTPVVPDVEPAGLLFITTLGGTPAPQTVTVYSGSTAGSGFQASATTTGGGSWLSVSPNTGTSSSGSAGITQVTVNASSLKAGSYSGQINYSLSATAVRSVNVTLIVTPPGTTGQSVTGKSADGVTSKASSCTPSKLVPVQTGLVNNFSAAVAWPVPLSVVLADDCANLITTGQMVATFSNGDPPLPLSLADSSKGIYSGTWTPRSSTAQMSVVAHASASGYPAAVVQVVGATTPNAAPVLTPHSTLHSFDPLVGAALAPGTIIQIYGQNLASGTFQPTTIPLPTSMNGTQVIIGGTPAPLYFVSPGQINAQLPFELTSGNQYSVLIMVNGALTTPDSVTLSQATPGMAAFGDGTLIAQHGDGTLVSASSPAKSGEYLVAYLAGMGPTNAEPASGAASPVSPLALPMAMPTLTINGAPYPIAFAGLTPGLVGLYQMNFQVPAGLPAGDITLVVTQGAQTSNQTVLPYTP